MESAFYNLEKNFLEDCPKGKTKERRKDSVYVCVCVHGDVKRANL